MRKGRDATQDILGLETDSTIVSSLSSRFELFIDLGTVDTAFIPSRALLSCPIKESRPIFPHKAGQSNDGSER
jgi:hypothetical protein